MKYHVAYPSGKTLTVNGTLKAGVLVKGSALMTPGVLKLGGEAVLFDPRVIIREHDAAGRVVFRGCTTEELTADVERVKSSTTDD